MTTAAADCFNELGWMDAPWRLNDKRRESRTAMAKSCAFTFVPARPNAMLPYALWYAIVRTEHKNGRVCAHANSLRKILISYMLIVLLFHAPTALA